MHLLLYVYLLTIPVFILGDLLWLGVIARSFYQAKLRHLLGPVFWPAAVIFYFAYVAGVVYFAVIPGLESSSRAHTLSTGAALGAFAYATYNLTNWATLKKWPVSIVCVDILWGAFLSCITAGAAFEIAMFLGV